MNILNILIDKVLEKEPQKEIAFKKIKSISELRKLLGEKYVDNLLEDLQVLKFYFLKN